MKVIGLTGGIGSGKSTVAQFLAELGAVIIDLDKVGHEALQQEEVRGQLVRKFGKDILNVSGEVDRTRLGKLVFNNREALARLNRIVHPVIDNMVNARIEEYRRKGVEVVVLEAAAMLEAGRASQVDELWVALAPEKVVLQRLSERNGYSGKETRARIDSQMSSEERIRHADVVIDSDCTLDELKVRVLAEWQKLQTRL
jgi:dephospho-CoA kinase